jgi:hypothetical protein
MPKQNPCFLTENYKKTEEIRQLEEKEFLAKEKLENSYDEEFESYSDLGVVNSSPMTCQLTE